MEVGFYGKLPSHGDFLRRRASDAFVAAWDAWLQASMSASRSALGDRWLDVYLTSPAWRFACAAGACGPSAVIGVMVPSVDRVGRYFPITLVATVPPAVDVLTAAVDGAAFFDSAERLVIDTLEAEDVDLEVFDGRALTLADTLVPLGVPRPVTLEPGAAAMLDDHAQPSWQMPIGAADRLPSVLLQLLSHQLARHYAPLGVWWTNGSGAVEPTCLVVGRGLPAPDGFAALLNGDWPGRRWQMAPARVVPAEWGDDPLAAGGQRLQFRSAAASDVGRSRALNEDAFLERREAGLWAVADGLGGHSDGEVASRMVCDALAELMPSPTFDEAIAAIRRRMAQVNEHLLDVARRSLLTDRCGSTVVTLLARGARVAVLWAGDSRAYRWRDGVLERLTTDHSAPVGVKARSDRSEVHAITRAVGAAPGFELDLVRDDVRGGDRFLLCSDGLTRLVPDALLATWMHERDVEAAVHGLLQAALEAGAPDNVTALIVEAYDDSMQTVR